MPSLISVITDSANRLTKHFSINPEGVLIKTAAEHLVNGHIETLPLDAKRLAALIPTLTQNQCLCLGQLEDFSQIQPLKCNSNANGAATRSKEFLDFRTMANWLLLDFDNTGLTPEQAIEVLTGIDPQFENASIVICPSSSSYLYQEDGTEIFGSGNFHLWAELHGDPAEYGMLLFNRLILKGYGFPKVTASGTIVIATIIDRSVLSPEREIFSADPVLGNGLVSKRLEHIAYQEGVPIKQDLFPVLDLDEETELRSIFLELREQAAPESAKKRAAYDDKRAEKKAIVNGTQKIHELAALTRTDVHYDKQGRPIMELTSDETIYDNEGQQIFVRDLLLNPEDGRKLPDPIEPFVRGDEARGQVGRGVATVLGNIIYSHNHAGCIFILRWQAADLIEWLSNPNNSIEEKKFVWRSIATNAQELCSATSDADLGEIADAFKTALGNLPGSGVGKDKKAVQKKLVIPKPSQDAEDPVLLKLNATYGIANMSGKAVVLYETWKKDLNLFETEVSNPFQMDLIHQGQQVKYNGQSVSAFKYWCFQAERNQYDGIVFLPDAKTIRKPGRLPVMPQGGTYNLWLGYICDFDKAVYPERILNHLKEVWCSGDEEEYEYVLNWFAYLYQKPGSVSTTALVLQSVPGTGKNLWIDGVIVKSLGIHALSTANRDDLTGRFNKQMGINVFTFANEATYAGEKADRSVLKNLMTDEFRNIELKGIDKARARNCTSLIFASNYSWVMALEANDRRLFYLTVSSARVGDKAYFDALAHEIENGGRDGFVKLMLERDISKFNIAKIPQTSNIQRMVDFLRTAHPVVRLIYSLADVDEDVGMYAEHAAYSRLRQWKTGEIDDLYLTRDQLFDLFRIYADRFQLNRNFEDIPAMVRELEVGGVLAMAGQKDKPMWRGKVGGKSVLHFKSVEECRKLLVGR